MTDEDQNWGFENRSVQATSVRFSWRLPYLPHGRVLARLRGSTGIKTAQANTVNGQLTVSGLEPSTRYYFKLTVYYIRAKTNLVRGSWLASGFVQTKSIGKQDFYHSTDVILFVYVERFEYFMQFDKRGIAQLFERCNFEVKYPEIK